MANVPNFPDHNGKRVRYGKSFPNWDGPAEPDYNHGGTVVCVPGDKGTIVEGFDNWNGVEDLKIFWVEFDRGTFTHLGYSEFDFIDAESN